MNSNAKSFADVLPAAEGFETIVLGAGCFWCTESVFQQLPGVTSVISGYTGGSVPNPTYEQICGGDTGHAEVARLTFDPKSISLKTILDTFWKMHDPTTPNRQGNDIGSQYRSAIFYADERQKEVAEQSRDEVAKKFSARIVTDIEPLGTFYPAENYHQDYYRQNKDRNPYCQYVITPKLDKLGLES